MNFTLLLIGIIDLLVIWACVVYLINALKLRDGVRKAVKYRLDRTATVVSDPLAIFSPSEINKLSVSPARSKVLFTRIPDPWSDDFSVESHLLAVHANRLRDISHLTKLSADLLLVAGTAVFGVAAGNFTQDVQFLDSSLTTMLLALLVILLALIANLTIVPAWRAAAEKYRERAFAPVVGQGLLALEENSVGSALLLPEAVVRGWRRKG